MFSGLFMEWVFRPVDFITLIQSYKINLAIKEVEISVSQVSKIIFYRRL